VSNRKPAVREGEESDEREEPARRPVPDVRKRPNESTSQIAGIMMLGGVMTFVLLLVFGVIAFLIWGPQPTAKEIKETVEEPKAEIKQGAWKPPFRLADSPGNQLMELRDNPRGIDRVAWSSDGKRVVTAGLDNVARVWDLESRTVVHTISGHTGPIHCVQFSVDSTRVLVASADNTARIWLLPQLAEAHRFTTPGKAMRAAQYTLENRWVLTGGDDPVVRLWDANNGLKVRDFLGHKGPVLALAVRPRGPSQALSASLDNSLRLWNIGDGKSLREFKHPQPVSACTFNAAGDACLSGSHDGKVRVFQTDTGKPLHIFDGHKGHVLTLSVSPTGRLALSGGTDNVIVLYDLQTRQKVRDFRANPRAVSALAFSPDGRHFAAGSHDGSLRIWGTPVVQ
jgi:WD40 repeat protein